MLEQSVTLFFFLSTLARLCDDYCLSCMIQPKRSKMFTDDVQDVRDLLTARRA